MSEVKRVLCVSELSWAHGVFLQEERRAAGNQSELSLSLSLSHTHTHTHTHTLIALRVLQLSQACGVSEDLFIPLISAVPVSKKQ